MSDIPLAWADHATDLADLIWQLLTVRADVWGCYFRKSVTLPDGTVTLQTEPMTAPAKAKRGQVYLDHGILASSFLEIL